MLAALCWVGMVASCLLILNVWPRGMLLICFVCFLSFVTAAQDFSAYQSDGMLLEAGFISLFFAPAGFHPGLAAASPPSRASLFLLLWEWFRIYFESGVAKIAGGDPEWRQFTAMDEYYQNGPLPTWIGWYVQHLPHWFHASTAVATLALELVVVWMFFLPCRWRILCFLIVTPWEIGIILTANYTFLNYLVLALGVLLLDDRALLRFIPQGWKKSLVNIPTVDMQAVTQLAEPSTGPEEMTHAQTTAGFRRHFHTVKVCISTIALAWIFYATMAELMAMFSLALPTAPVEALDPFRIANRYGLFGIMTRGRYEIEFQGSEDGKTWVPYPFRYKPQDVSKPTGIYAPYQPRFDWNLWFASLGSWQEYSIVPRTEVQLLSNNRDVVELFARNPFPNGPPREVRAVVWQYWFTTMSEKRTQGLWWRRQFVGLYAPTIERESDGKIRAIEWPTASARE